MYNPRLQPHRVTDANSSGALIYQEILTWGPNTSSPNCSYTGSDGTNNGVLWQIVQSQEGRGYPFSSFTQTFAYDVVNRLKWIVENSDWSRVYSYDQFGNLTVTGATGIAPSGQTPLAGAYNAGNNQLTTQYGTYDAEGNQSTFGSYTPIPRRSHAFGVWRPRTAEPEYSSDDRLIARWACTDDARQWSRSGNYARVRQ